VVGGFEIGYVTDDGPEHRVSLSQAWATTVRVVQPDTPLNRGRRRLRELLASVARERGYDLTRESNRL